MNKRAVYICLVVGLVVVAAFCMVCNTNHTTLKEVVDAPICTYDYNNLKQSYSGELFDVYTHNTSDELVEVTTSCLKQVEVSNSKLLYCDYLDLVGDVFGMVVMDGSDCEVVVIRQVEDECEVKVVRFYKDGFRQW